MQIHLISHNRKVSLACDPEKRTFAVIQGDSVVVRGLAGEPVQIVSVEHAGENVPQDSRDRSFAFAVTELGPQTVNITGTDGITHKLHLMCIEERYLRVVPMARGHATVANVRRVLDSAAQHGALAPSGLFEGGINFVQFGGANGDIGVTLTSAAFASA